VEKFIPDRYNAEEVDMIISVEIDEVSADSQAVYDTFADLQCSAGLRKSSCSWEEVYVVLPMDLCSQASVAGYDAPD
jgi:hypothetical protein